MSGAVETASVPTTGTTASNEGDCQASATASVPITTALDKSNDTNNSNSETSVPPQSSAGVEGAESSSNDNNNNTNNTNDANTNSNNNDTATTTSTRRVTIGHSTSNSVTNASTAGSANYIPMNDNSTNMMNNSNSNTGAMMMMNNPNTNNNMMMMNNSVAGGFSSGASIGGNSMTGVSGNVNPVFNNSNSASNLNMMMDHRRGSMGSMGGFGMDDFFGGGGGSTAGGGIGNIGRRNSFGFDMGMEHFFGRRDSMDSSTAALDMAIMDISRRRYSAAAMGAMGQPNAGTSLPMGPPGSTPDHLLGVGGGSSVGGMGNNFGFPTNHPQQHGGSAMMMGSMGTPPVGGANNNNNSTDSIVQRQQQLQQQQRELEQRQKELEFQRQQLISSMQERSSFGGPANMVGAGATGMGSPAGSGVMPPLYHPNHHHIHGPHHPHRGSFGGLGGSLGLGSVQSNNTGSITSSHMQNSSSQHIPSSSTHRTSATNTTTGSAGGSTGSSAGTQKWWICQVCQSKAFVSQDEALAHEAICQEVRHSMPPMPYTHDIGMGGMGMGMGGMGRNFSMGFGMDTSQRSGMGMGMGMGMNGMGGITTMIDNSSRGVVSLGMDSSRGGSSMDFDRSRNMSLGMDSSSSNYTNYGGMTMSTGPVNMFIQPVPLAMPSDKDWLTPLHCFVRLSCVEVFTATKADVATPSKGKRKPIQVGQVGIRCPHCSGTADPKSRERGSVYYPTSISSIYNATMNLLQRHLHNCPSVPDDIMRRYETLKADDARSGTSKRYWIESALSLGLVDTPDGIRHSALPPPPLPTLTRQQETTGQDVARRASNEYFGNNSNLVPRDKSEAGHGGIASGDNSGKEMSYSDPTTMIPLVLETDLPYATEFSYQLMDQMQPCVFTEADRLGKRKGLPPGFPGLACRHCFGGYGSGRFFPSTIKTLSDTSKTLNVLHNHMMRCRKCPSDVKEKLEKLRVSHDDERSKMKFGSQKAFFGRIWDRLHGGAQGNTGYMNDASQRKTKGSKRAAMDQHHHQQDQLLNGYDMHGGAMGGLDALAAASSPSKRSKA